MDLFSQFFQENQKKFLSFAYSYTRNKAAAEATDNAPDDGQGQRVVHQRRRRNGNP